MLAAQWLCYSRFTVSFGVWAAGVGDRPVGGAVSDTGGVYPKVVPVFARRAPREVSLCLALSLFPQNQSHALLDAGAGPTQPFLYAYVR